MNGKEILRNPHLNKGTAFSQEEREKYGLEGLLPIKIETLETQISRVMGQLEQYKTNIEKYIYL
ncbi:MAG: NAD-dependent malic enzyme, partial [Lutimonas sp.]